MCTCVRQAFLNDLANELAGSDVVKLQKLQQRLQRYLMQKDAAYTRKVADNEDEPAKRSQAKTRSYVSSIINTCASAASDFLRAEAAPTPTSESSSFCSTNVPLHHPPPPPPPPPSPPSPTKPTHFNMASQPPPQSSPSPSPSHPAPQLPLQPNIPSVDDLADAVRARGHEGTTCADHTPALSRQDDKVILCLLETVPQSRSITDMLEQTRVSVDGTTITVNCPVAESSSGGGGGGGARTIVLYLPHKNKDKDIAIDSQLLSKNMASLVLLYRHVLNINADFVVYYDPAARINAFNLRNCVWYNLASVTPDAAVDCLKEWFLTICHEFAHAKHHHHDSFFADEMAKIAMTLAPQFYTTTSRSC